MKKLALACVSSLALSIVASGAVIVVDGPGQDPSFSLLQAAVDGAAPGDIVLVRPGAYWESFKTLIVRKGITIVADGTEPTVLAWGVDVLSVPAGEQVSIRGFKIGFVKGLGAFAGPQLPALRVAGCVGSVWVEDCWIRGSSTDHPWGGANPGGPGVEVTNSARCVFTSSTLHGGNPPAHPESPSARKGGHALVVSAGVVALFDCDLLGGDHAPGASLPLTETGGDGLLATNATVYVGGSVLTGGQGGPYGNAATIGGTALTLRDAILQSDTLTGTAAIQSSSSTFQTLPSAWKELDIDAPVATGDSATATMTGPPGELAWIVVGATHDPALELALEGVRVTPVSAVSNRLFLGPIPPSASRTIPFVAPPLPPSIDGYQVFAQLVTITPGSAAVTLDGSSLFIQVKSGL